MQHWYRATARSVLYLPNFLTPAETFRQLLGNDDGGYSRALREKWDLVLVSCVIHREDNPHNRNLQSALSPTSPYYLSLQTWQSGTVSIKQSSDAYRVMVRG